MASHPLSFNYEAQSPSTAHSSVTVHNELAAPINKTIVNLYRTYTALPGYENKELPHSYAASYFAREISRDTQLFLFNHFAIDFLLRELQSHAVIYSNLPRLEDVIEQSNGDVTYLFALSTPPKIPLREWRHFVFKQPNRKNYKDLDNQVMLFLKEAQEHNKQRDAELVEAHDWVMFSALLINPETNEPLAPYPLRYWIRITGDTIKNTLQESLTGCSKGDTFTAQTLPLNNDVQTFTKDPCSYAITVEEVSKGSFLNVDFFKHSFRLKTRADIHKKLIEVFSYRNDISQRKSIIEELFHLLFTKHRFEIPKYIITRRQELLLSTIKQQPDFHIYKTHQNFDRNLFLLAEKLLKEEYIVDAIAQQEKLTVTQTDIAAYLHLFNNERLKEFVYFRPLQQTLDDDATPLAEGLLLQTVLREKTLNHIIHVLS
jgi:FKBP-type peptidyl-prolyl cis-trans isomerase (trigger factor)